MVGFLPAELVELTQAQFEVQYEKRNPKKPNSRDYTMKEKQEWYSGFLWIARERKKNRGYAFHLFTEKFGVTPRSLMRIERKPTIEVEAWERRRRNEYKKKLEAEKEVTA